MLSAGERCKKYAQKYGLCRKHVNYNIGDIVQNLLEGEVIQESQGPEGGKRKLVAIRAGVLLSPDYMEVDFDLERTSDNDVEHCCYPTTQTTMWTEEIIMEGGLETEESETFTDSFNGLSVPDGGLVIMNESVDKDDITGDYWHCNICGRYYAKLDSTQHEFVRATGMTHCCKQVACYVCLDKALKDDNNRCPLCKEVCDHVKFCEHHPDIDIQKDRDYAVYHEPNDVVMHDI